MGVYYFFINTRTNTVNEQPIPGYEPCTHIAKLDSLDVNLEQIFQSVISANHDWLPTDIITAWPDYPYHDQFTYDNGAITSEVVVPNDDMIFDCPCEV